MVHGCWLHWGNPKGADLQVGHVCNVGIWEDQPLTLEEYGQHFIGEEGMVHGCGLVGASCDCHI